MLFASAYDFINAGRGKLTHLYSQADVPSVAGCLHLSAITLHVADFWDGLDHHAHQQSKAGGDRLRAKDPCLCLYVRYRTASPLGSGKCC